MAEAPHPNAIRRIVVGVDGSEHSAAALLWAIDLAKALGAEIVAVFAIHHPDFNFSSYMPVPQPGLDPEWLAEMTRLLEDDWCKPLRDAGIKHRALMEDGRPAQVIARIADRVDADLVAVGRRGRGGVQELLLGSVSHEVSQQCKQPVLLISQLPGRTGDEH
ncbi:MAG: universal stress protein [Actinomycetota bacterium]|nr:universal stress protein [Actinomycetota bacterium]